MTLNINIKEIMERQLKNMKRRKRIKRGLQKAYEEFQLKNKASFEKKSL